MGGHQEAWRGLPRIELERPGGEPQRQLLVPGLQGFLGLWVDPVLTGLRPPSRRQSVLRG